jgi:hypothetical protein
MKPRWVLVIVGLFVVVQIAVPTVMLFEPRPAAFGWQMYSAARSLPDVVVIEADGSERVVDLTDHLAEPRAEIDYAARLAEQACRVIGGPRVRVTPDGGPPIEIECE